jgi:NAD(P)-dependent dehydrogenase (short-subunit alcohol dehydrogenase family)
MQQRILITGASSGLGRALALEHAAQGDRLVLLARRLDRLKALAAECRQAGAPELFIQKGDVSRRGDQDKALRGIRAWGGLDAVYANAGYSQSGRVESMGLAQWRAQMAVNVEGVLHTVQASLPFLKAAQGRLILVGSVVSYATMTGSGAYAASKAAVRALAQVLDLELQGTGVSVTYAAPGFFRSEIRLKDPDGRPDPGAAEYLPAWLLGDERVLARELREAAWERRRELVWPLHAKIAVFVIRHLPGLAQAVARQASAAREARRRKVQGR